MGHIDNKEGEKGKNYENSNHLRHDQVIAYMTTDCNATTHLISQQITSRQFVLTTLELA